MSSDDARKSAQDVKFIVGGGSSMARLCSRCNLRKEQLGGRGLAPRWYCKACVALRAQA